MQNASEVNTFLTFLFCFSRFGGVYSTFIDVTTFQKVRTSKGGWKHVEKNRRKRLEM